MGIKTIGKFPEKNNTNNDPCICCSRINSYILKCKSTNAFFPKYLQNALKSAAVGGFAEQLYFAAMRNGFARGVYSNESGMGTAPVAHSSATTSYAAKQGL